MSYSIETDKKWQAKWAERERSYIASKCSHTRPALTFT